MKNMKWQREVTQIANDYYRHYWNTDKTPEEVFEDAAKKHQNEAGYAEMKKFFEQKMVEAKEFYADTETVAALMACNH